jgi:CheY-like chemotaxis protein
MGTSASNCGGGTDGIGRRKSTVAIAPNIGAAHPVFELVERIIKQAPRSNTFVVASFQMILFDSISRHAFITYIEQNYSTVNLEFYDGVSRFKTMIETHQDMDDIEFFAHSAMLLQLALVPRLKVHMSLKTDLQTLYRLSNNATRQEVMLCLDEAQADIIASMDKLLLNFETSPQFADFIHYSSVAMSMKSNFSVSGTRRRKSKSANPAVRGSADHADAFSSLRLSFSGRSREILIVENVPIVAKILICNLQKSFRRVIHAFNSKQALEFLSQRAFDVVLYSVDVAMEDSLDVIVKYKERCEESHIKPDKFVGMVSDPQSPLISDAMSLGFRKVLVKPFNEHDVLAALLH